MARVTTHLESNAWRGAKCIERNATVSRLIYWLPTIVIGWGLFVAEHDVWYAEMASGNTETEREVDLSDDVNRSSSMRQFGFLSIGLLGGLPLLFRPHRACLVDHRLLGAMLLLCGWILLSAIWSDEIDVSLRRSMLPLLMLVAALGVARLWRPEQLCLMAVHLGLAYIAIGIVTELRVGTFLRGDDYRFSGTLHPNSQAVNCIAVVLGSICLYQGGSKHKRTWLLAAAFAFAMLLLTGSRTALITLVAATFAIFAWRASLRQRVVWGLGGGIALCVGSLVFLLAGDSDPSDSMLNAARMGRHQDSGDVSSLTGRIPIWQEIARQITKRPLVGYGYGGFWTGERVYELSAILDWEFNHAHSLYLEAMLNVGLVGLVIGATIALMGMQRSAGAVRQTGNTSYQFILTWLWAGTIHGLTEPSFIQPELATLVGMIGLSLLVFREHPAGEARI